MEHKVQGVIYRQQYRRCGKENCASCREGEGHGPYWYAITTGEPIKYIGKELPGFVSQYQNRLKEQKPKIDAVRTELTKRRDEANRQATEFAKVIQQIDNAERGEHFENNLLVQNGIEIYLV